MIRGLYTAANSMNSMQHQIDVTSNTMLILLDLNKIELSFKIWCKKTLNYTAGSKLQKLRWILQVLMLVLGLISGVQKKIFTEGDAKQTSNTFDVAIQKKVSSK